MCSQAEHPSPVSRPGSLLPRCAATGFMERKMQAGFMERKSPFGGSVTGAGLPPLALALHAQVSPHSRTR